MDADSGEDDDSEDDDIDNFTLRPERYQRQKQAALNSIKDIGVRLTFSRRIDDIERRLSGPFAGDKAVQDALLRALGEARAAGAGVPWQHFPRPPP